MQKLVPVHAWRRGGRGGVKGQAQMAVAVRQALVGRLQESNACKL